MTMRPVKIKNPKIENPSQKKSIFNITNTTVRKRRAFRLSTVSWILRH